MIVYGIPNCNTVKKALDWLKKHRVEFSFHDFKKQGITAEKLDQWADQLGWENLLNKKGTTWRQLPAEEQEKVNTRERAIALIIQKPSVTKRPILESKNQVISIGFDEARYAQVLNI